MLEQPYLTAPKYPDIRFFGGAPKSKLPLQELFCLQAISHSLAGKGRATEKLAQAMAAPIRENLAKEGFARKLFPPMQVDVEHCIHDAVVGTVRSPAGLGFYGTTSGRTSSSQPNLQNIPRSDFPAGYTSRLFSLLDKGLEAKRLLMNEQDYHDILSFSTKQCRDAAKAINFGLAYGATPEKVADAIYQGVYGGGKTATRFLEDQYLSKSPKYVVPRITKEDRKAYEHDVLLALERKAVQDIQRQEDAEFFKVLDQYSREDVKFTEKLYKVMKVR